MDEEKTFVFAVEPVCAMPMSTGSMEPGSEVAVAVMAHLTTRIQLLQSGSLLVSGNPKDCSIESHVHEVLAFFRKSRNAFTASL